MEEIMREYTDLLLGSGYKEAWVEEVIGPTLQGYEKVLEEERQGKTTRNRSGVSTSTARRAKALAGKSNWYRKKSKKTPPQDGRRVARNAPPTHTPPPHHPL